MSRLKTYDLGRFKPSPRCVVPDCSRKHVYILPDGETACAEHYRAEFEKRL